MNRARLMLSPLLLFACATPPTPTPTIVSTPPAPAVSTPSIPAAPSPNAKTLRGRLHDAADKPIVGATVKAGTLNATSDAEGRFEIKAIEQVERADPRVSTGLHVVLDIETREGLRLQRPARTDLPEVPLSIFVPHKVTIAGRLFERDGKPVVDASVTALGVGSARTDQNGAYRIMNDHVSRLGPVPMQANTGQGVMADWTLTLEHPGETTNAFQLPSWDDPDMTRIRVRTTSGQPVEGAQINGRFASKSGDLAFRSPEGAAFLELKMNVHFKRSWWQTRTVGLPWTGDVTFLVPDGSVLLPQIPPHWEGTAHRLKCLSGCTPADEGRVVTYEDTLGGLRWSGIAAGRWRSPVQSADGGTGFAEFEVKDGAEVIATAQLIPPGKAHGRLVDAKTGKPLALALLEGRSWEFGNFLQVHSDVEGRFELTGLAPGHHVVGISPLHADDRTIMFDTKSGQALDLGTIRISPRGLRGHLAEQHDQGLYVDAGSKGIRLSTSDFAPPELKRLIGEGGWVTSVNGRKTAGLKVDEVEALLDVADPARVTLRTEAGRSRNINLPATAWKAPGLPRDVLNRGDPL